jgi:hypothetical protein
MPELNARIPCAAETRAELRALKNSSDERYEDVLRRLLRDYKNNA